jgi:hypothetical protein
MAIKIMQAVINDNGYKKIAAIARRAVINDHGYKNPISATTIRQK